MADNVGLQHSHGTSVVNQSLSDIAMSLNKGFSGSVLFNSLISTQLSKWFQAHIDRVHSAGQLASNFDTYHFLAIAVFLLSNNLVNWNRSPEQYHTLFEILFRRIPSGILLVLVADDLLTTRAAWEALVLLSNDSRREHAFSLLMDIGLKNNELIIPNGHLYLSFAASFGSLDIVQKLLNIGARPDEPYLKRPMGWYTCKSALCAAVSGRSLDCVKLLLQHCDVNRIMYDSGWGEERLSNFGIFLSEFKGRDELENQVLRLLLEARADVNTIWTGAHSNFSELSDTIITSQLWPLSILDWGFYQNIDLYANAESLTLYETLLCYSHRAANEITRAGICLAARQGKAGLRLYLQTRKQHRPRGLQNFLELVLAEQFVLKRWRIDTKAVRGFIDFGVNIKLPSMDVDISLLMYRLVVTARLHGANEDIVAILTHLIEQGAVLDSSVVEAAIDEKGLGMLPLLASFNADIQSHGGQALERAARIDNYEAASWLLRAGVDVNILVYEYEETPTVIYRATSYGSVRPSWKWFQEARLGSSVSYEMFHYLIRQDAELRRRLDRNDPLTLLKRLLLDPPKDSSLLDKVQLLLDSGADPSDSSSSHTYLLEACFPQYPWETPHPQSLATFELLFRRGAPVRPGGALALLILFGGRPELIEEVLESGANIHSYSGLQGGRVQYTPLQAAAARGDQDLVLNLLRKGADLNRSASGNCGRTALQAACEARQMKVIRLLINHGADVNAPASKYDFFGGTALQMAACRGDLELAFLLLNHGADPNATVQNYCEEVGDCTILDKAARYGRLDMVQLLLDVGAVSYLRGQTGYEGAIQAAKENGYLAVQDLLKRHAAKNPATSSIGNSIGSYEYKSEDFLSDNEGQGTDGEDWLFDSDSEDTSSENESSMYDSGTDSAFISQDSDSENGSVGYVVSTSDSDDET